MLYPIIQRARAALKEYKENPEKLVIIVGESGLIECRELNAWNAEAAGFRIDNKACDSYKVIPAQLSETMIKTTAAKILKGEL